MLKRFLTADARFSALTLVIGAFVGFGFAAFPSSPLALESDCGGILPLLNPWIRCEPDLNSFQKQEYSDFKAGLLLRIDEWIQADRADHVSVYFRDLHFGPWMGIDETEPYSAASLLKVPVLMAIYRLAERDESVLKQRVQITQEIFSEYALNFPGTRGVLPGQIYTVQDLVERMIVDSDNNAVNALHAYMNQISPSEPLFMIMLEEMGLIGEHRTEDLVTVKQAASMFRLLYNGSFLSKDMSNKALDLLSRTSFVSGLRAGVPAHVLVSHKFGERRMPNGARQLHDCGIVYAPSTHYLLCVMTKGDDPQILAEVIQEVSRRMYEEVESRAEQQANAAS